MERSRSGVVLDLGRQAGDVGADIGSQISEGSCLCKPLGGVSSGVSGGRYLRSDHLTKERLRRGDGLGRLHSKVRPMGRPAQAMPNDVRQHLSERKLFNAYEARPFYQRNDYLAWIGRAKRPETRQARIDQMLDELDRGGVYMKMDHPPSRQT